MGGFLHLSDIHKSDTRRSIIANVHAICLVYCSSILGGHVRGRYGGLLWLMM